MATLVQYPAITLDNGNNTCFYYHKVAIKASFRSARQLKVRAVLRATAQLVLPAAAGRPQKVTGPFFFEKIETVPRAWLIKTTFVSGGTLLRFVADAD